MENPAISHLLQSIAYQIPMMLVYLGGMVFALAYFRRCPSSSILTLVAMTALLVTLFGSACTRAFLINLNMEGNWDMEGFSLMMSTIGVISNILRALATAMLVTAIFTGRKPELNKSFQPSDTTSPFQDIHHPPS